jgi:hypothetical protein
MGNFFVGKCERGGAIFLPSWPPMPSTTMLDRGPARRWSTGKGRFKKTLAPRRHNAGLAWREGGKGAYGDRVWHAPSLSADVDPLGRFRRARLVVAEFVPLHPYAHDLTLVDVQPLGFGRIEQFVSRGCLGTRKPEICAFVGITGCGAVRSSVFFFWLTK